MSRREVDLAECSAMPGTRAVAAEALRGLIDEVRATPEGDGNAGELAAIASVAQPLATVATWPVKSGPPALRNKHRDLVCGFDARAAPALWHASLDLFDYWGCPCDRGDDLAPLVERLRREGSSGLLHRQKPDAAIGTKPQRQEHSESSAAECIAAMLPTGSHRRR